MLAVPGETHQEVRQEVFTPETKPITEYMCANVLEMNRMGNYGTELIAKFNGITPARVLDIIREGSEAA